MIHVIRHQFSMHFISQIITNAEKLLRVPSIGSNNCYSASINTSLTAIDWMYI